MEAMPKHPLASCLAAALVCAALPRIAAAGEAGHRPTPGAEATGAPAWRETGVSLPVRFDERLKREALRYTDLAAPRALSPLADQDFEDDEESRAARSRRVERLLTRAIRRALDDHLSDLARTSPAFEGLFRVLDAREADTARREPAAMPHGGATSAAPARGFEADVRVKIDAHPRLQMRARMGAVTGSIEIPVLDPEVRVGLERPLGTRGRAALQGGWSDGRGEWAAVALSFSF